MKDRHRPPRLPLAVLERLVPGSASLAGDLAEEFERRPSQAWLWWQVAAAVALVRFRRPDDEIRPLRLVDLQPSDAQVRSRTLSRRFVTVNLTASPIHGIGGLGLVAFSLIVTWVTPGAWLLPAASLVGGALLGIILIAHRRAH